MKNSLKVRGTKLLNMIIGSELYDISFTSRLQVQNFVHKFKDSVLLFDEELVDLELLDQLNLLLPELNVSPLTS